jgi:putative nucleotidyltransferase with HDIG domain
MRLILARRREKNAASASQPRSLGRKLLNYFALLAILLGGIYIMGQNGVANSIADHIMRGVTLVVLVICGWQLLRIVAPNAPSMRTHLPLMLAMLMLAFAEARLADFAYGRLVVPLLPGVSNDNAHMFAYPNAVVPFIVALLYGGPVALVIGVVTSATIAISAGEAFNLGAYIVALCATCVIANEAPKISRRSQMTPVVFRIGVMQAFILTIILYRQRELGIGPVLLQACFFYAFLAVSAIVFAFVILPVAERVTRRVGNISISRYADLESPLLRRLSLEAPGTYHHAMMVGNLAQAAAEAIGANGVLARAGSYYHDIGKLGQPHYFMENQSGSDNPHDDLPPNISRIILMNHVKEGMVLAELNHLPPALRRFIETHHGTSIVRWFLIKERKRLEAKGGESVPGDELADFFRYPGPLPETREETIVSLADSIEAASRSMRFFDHDKIERLVRDIIQDRWTDGQLARSELTNAELDKVRDSFISTLVPLLHGRLPYPSQK